MVVPDVANVVERVRPAVVAVLVEVVERDFFGATRASFGSGTGVIITADGYVITKQPRYRKSEQDHGHAGRQQPSGGRVGGG